MRLIAKNGGKTSKDGPDEIRAGNETKSRTFLRAAPAGGSRPGATRRGTHSHGRKVPTRLDLVVVAWHMLAATTPDTRQPPPGLAIPTRA
ncbi:hypothetical protein GCM10017778_64460 [Streptomyces vinaceus]|nr:hypothetical protein GCM10017778_64460 [Streptomyces vinaceus]